MECYIGSIILFAGNYAPINFLPCDGRLLPVSRYTAVFSLLGNTYGGDGRTTFGLPDLRGRAAVGMGQGPGLPLVDWGEQGGSQTYTLITSEMATHGHNGTINSAGIPGTTPTPVSNLMLATPVDSIGQEYGMFSPISAAPGLLKLASPAATVFPTGNNIPFNIMQPYTALNYLICMEGIFPSRN